MNKIICGDSTTELKNIATVRATFDLAKKNPDRKFLFIFDGLEVYITWNIAKGMIQTGRYDNVVWSTKKLLPVLRFHELTFQEPIIR